MVPRRRTLTVGVTPAEHGLTTPFLDRGQFEIDRLPSAVGSIELLLDVPIDLVLVRYPLPGMELGDFLGMLRSSASASRRSSVVILAEDDRARAAAESFVGLGANKIVRLDEDPARIQLTVADVLRVAPRLETRFLARLESTGNGNGQSTPVRMDDAASPPGAESSADEQPTHGPDSHSLGVVLGLVRNTSASGLLVESEHLYRVGADLGFEITLPAGERPVRGGAEVVRHTRPERERVRGMGLRILGFAENGGDTFNAYLKSLAGH